MHHILFLFLLFNSVNFLAQVKNPVQCDTEINCIQNPDFLNTSTISSDYYLKNKGSWYTSDGSPSPSSSSVWLWSYGGFGEGIYTCFTFKQNKRYRLEIKLNTTNAPTTISYNDPTAKMYVKLANNNLGFTPVVSGCQTVFDQKITNPEYQTFTVEFTANDNYKYLQLNPYMRQNVSRSSDQLEVSIDRIDVYEIPNTDPTLVFENNIYSIRNSPSNFPNVTWEWTFTQNGVTTVSNSNQFIPNNFCDPYTIKAKWTHPCEGGGTIELTGTNPYANLNLDLSIQGNSVICFNETATLKIVNNPNFTYEWFSVNQNGTHSQLTNGSIFSGVTTSELTILGDLSLNKFNFYCKAYNKFGCEMDSETFLLQVLSIPTIPIINVTQPLCGESLGKVEIENFNTNFSYELNGVHLQNQTAWLNLPLGSYTLQAKNGNCNSENVYFDILTPTNLNFRVEYTSSCGEIIAQVITDSEARFFWQDGSTNSFNTFKEPGVYNVQISLNNCSIYETIDLTSFNNFIPNGISPNGDGLNDVLDLSHFGNVNSLKIFNRYGREVYSKNNYTNEWFGQSTNNSKLPSGTYFYVITCNGQNKTGWIYIRI